MRSGVFGFVVVHLFAMQLTSSVAFAEQKTATAAANGEEVSAEDLALGKPAPVQSAQPQPAPAAPATTPPTVAPPTAAAPQTAAVTPTAVTQPPVETVPNPMLASTAVIANGVQTTAVVDIRLLPKQLPYRGENAMDGYVLDERRRWWMIILGGALFGIGYVGSIAVGGDHDFDNGFGFTPIPLAGPWITMATHDDECLDEDFCVEDSSVDAQLGALGVLQLAGAVLLPIGLMSTKQVWIRKDLALGIAPTRLGRSGYGAVLEGTF